MGRDRVHTYWSETLNFVLFAHHSIGMGNTVLALYKIAREKFAVISATEARSYKAQISSGVSKTTVTLERLSPCDSLRTSTTSESTCNIKFLIICLSASECTLQGYGGVASALYVASSGACDNVRYT